MKKEYMKPAFEEIEMSVENNILDASQVRVGIGKDVDDESEDFTIG